MNIPPVTFIIAEIFVLFFGIGLHEYAHCKFADMAGDPTPGIYGRVTLNLTKHFELAGTLMILLTTLTGFGIGWGRPAPMDPRKMKNPRWDWFAAVAAGPITNLLQAIVYAVLYRALMRNLTGNDPVTETVQYILTFGVITNLALFLFNLIPFGPLDGKWLLGLLLPEKPRWHWFKLNDQIGVPGLFILIVILQTAHISLISAPIRYGFNLLTGNQI